MWKHNVGHQRIRIIVMTEVHILMRTKRVKREKEADFQCSNNRRVLYLSYSQIGTLDDHNQQDHSMSEKIAQIAFCRLQKGVVG